MKSSLINSIGEVVTDYGARVMKVFKKGLLGRSLFDFYGDIKADALRTNESSAAPGTPADGKGGVIYTKSADGKLYYKSNEVSEIELSNDNVLSTEEVQDLVGGMVTGNTESGITVTYQDGDGTLDFTVGTLNQDTTGNAATATALETARAINGVDFNGTAPITVTAAGSTLSDTVPISKGGTGATTASAARSALGVDAAGTDNSTNVTLAGTPDYITISGQEITRNAIDLTADVSGTLPVANGGTGVASLTEDNILTGNGTSGIIAESALTYTSADEELVIGNPDSGVSKVSRRHSSGTNGAGGNLILTAGAATGNAAGGSIEFHSSVAGSSGSTVQSTTEIATIDKDGNLSIDGDLTVKGNDIKDDDGTVCITFDSSGNTTVANTLNASVTGNVTGNASGSSGSCTGNAATATALTAGDKTIDGNVNIGANTAGHSFTVHGATTNFANMKWDATYDFLKFTDAAKIVFGTGSASGDFDSSIQADGSNLVIYNDTGNIQIGDTVEITGDLTTTGGIELGHSSDTTIARTAAGTVSIEGKEIVTINKQKNIHSYAYHYSGTSAHFIPMSGATTSDSTGLTATSYHLMQVMPFDGRVVRIAVFNQTTTSRTDLFEMYIDGDDSDPAADQRGTDLSFTSTQKGNGDCATDWTFSKGEAIAIRRTPSAAVNGTTITVVFEFDMTT